jgi:hypothetical protein
VNLDMSFHPVDSRWRLSAAVTWHSGWPYSTTFVRVDTVMRTPESYSLAGLSPAGWLQHGPVAGIQRIDVRWMRFLDTPRWHGSVFAEIYNVFNTINPRGTQLRAVRRARRVHSSAGLQSSIPRLPAIGVSWDF